MLLHRESGGFPSLHVVAGSALAAIRPLHELPLVRIGFVTVHAFRKNEGLLEIAISVALGAFHRGMLAFQRELRFRVVEAFIHRLQRNLLPAAGVVARLAALREAAVVRIFVAVRAGIERNAGILRLPIRSVYMALGALHLCVQSGQRIACL